MNFLIRNLHLQFFSILLALFYSQLVIADGASHLGGAVTCVDGQAHGYSCSRITMLGHLSTAAFDLGTLSDIWGWTDPLTDKEYAIIGHFNGTSFVDISQPTAPLMIGYLPAHEDVTAFVATQKSCANSTKANIQGYKNVAIAHGDDDDGDCDGGEGSNWRDIKVYANHAFIVSESPGHGMQVFDLTRLRNEPVGSVFDEDAHFGGFGDAHNIVINEDTGFAYVVGAQQYSGGLFFIDISNPKAPVHAGGFSGDGYTHDAQCVTYTGPDADYTGREICFACNEDSVTIVDVTQKNSPVMVARKGYSDAHYIHQGWLSTDHRYFYQNDELDERENGMRTRTQIWDMQNLDNPVVLKSYFGVTRTIDHNNYTVGDYLFQSNYSSGLRVLSLQDPGDPLEIAHFDSYRFDDAISFDGTWSNYPYFPSGTVALSDRSEGLFLLSMMFMESGLLQTDIGVSVGDAEELSVGPTGRIAFRYSATISNHGSETADDVVVTHVLTPGANVNLVNGTATCSQRTDFLDCQLGSLLAGESLTLIIDLDVPQASRATFEVRGSALNPDLEHGNNKDSGSINLSFTAPIVPGGSGGGGGSGSLGVIGCLMLLVVGVCRINGQLVRRQSVAEYLLPSRAQTQR